MMALGLVLAALGLGLAALAWTAIGASPIVQKRDQQNLSTGAALAALGIIVFILSFFFEPAPAEAQPIAASPPLICGADAGFVERLAAIFGEQEIGDGIVTDQVVVRIFASPGGATFSIVATDLNGMTCLMASGTDLDVRQPADAKERRS